MRVHVNGEILRQRERLAALFTRVLRSYTRILTLDTRGMCYDISNDSQHK